MENECGGGVDAQNKKGVEYDDGREDFLSFGGSPILEWFTC